jgi:hypothetical protein
MAEDMRMTSICWKGIVIGSAYSLARHGGIATNMFGAASDVELLRMADEASQSGLRELGNLKVFPALKAFPGEWESEEYGVFWEAEGEAPKEGYAVWVETMKRWIEHGI